MVNPRTLIAVPVFILVMSLDASADGLHCSRQQSGVTSRVVEINRYRILDNVNPNSVGFPTEFRVDFENKKLIPSKDSRIKRSVPIKWVDQLENKLVIQGVDEGIEGVEDGLAWSLVISKDNGKAVLSAAGNGVAYAVFGVCKPTNGPK